MTTPLSLPLWTWQTAARPRLDNPYAHAPLLVALVAALLLLGLHPLGLPSVGASAFLIACGLCAGRSLTALHAEAIAEAQRDAQREVKRLSQVCSVSAPLWIRQIETVRVEADREIAELTRVLGQITHRLDRALATPGLTQGGTTASHDILSTLEGNRADLERLVGALDALQTGKERIVAEIGLEAARLKECASEIRQIALQTRMVTLNATIEAARAGTAGRAFAVVVDDMREVAARTAEASEHFSRQTDRLHAMVNAAFDEHTTSGSAASMQWAQELVHQVVDSFADTTGQLTRAIETMAHERLDVRDDMSRLLVPLQFQDRVSQILGHLSLNVQELQRQVESGHGESLETRQWLEYMAEQYSTPEEFTNLEPARPVARTDSEITYF